MNNENGNVEAGGASGGGVGGRVKAWVGSVGGGGLLLSLRRLFRRSGIIRGEVMILLSLSQSCLQQA